MHWSTVILTSFFYSHLRFCFTNIFKSNRSEFFRNLISKNCYLHMPHKHFKVEKKVIKPEHFTCIEINYLL